jgi:hypothetical protein
MCAVLIVKPHYSLKDRIYPSVTQKQWQSTTITYHLNPRKAENKSVYKKMRRKKTVKILLNIIMEFLYSYEVPEMNKITK